ncbi:hypothetical protein BH10PSE7_BH10PSE7_23920 [soil metagenome]
MKFAPVNGIALHYDVTGDNSLPPLVFSKSLGTVSVSGIRSLQA